MTDLRHLAIFPLLYGDNASYAELGIKSTMPAGTDHIRIFGPDNPRDELRTLWNAHRTGNIVLKDEEARALSWWLSRKNHDKDRLR